jgi:AcrR family transcriptional regulator
VNRVSATAPSTPAAPARLPSGRHRIPDQEVRDNQHTRLVDAVTQLSAERGYANVVIADIVGRAAVSKSTFYRFYRTKEECLFDAHKRHSAALIAAIDSSHRVEEPSATEQPGSGVRTALAYLSAHPQAANLLSIGILSCGPRGAQRYAVMIDALRARLQCAGALPPTDAALAAVLFAASALTYTVTRGQPLIAFDAVERLLAIADQGQGARA